MSVTISIRFLTGRAHLHPWQTHHSEGRVEWPPSPWRLLRALVAVAGRGLTSLPYPDDVPPLKHEAVVNVEGMAKPNERGVPPETKKKLSFSKQKQTLTLKAPLTDAELDAWKAANPGDGFAAVIDELQELAAAPNPVAMGDTESDEIPLSQLAELLHKLSAVPIIWLPKTGGGHTRQYFPIHSGGAVKNTGSAVFDTFATVRKDQPLLFHWPNQDLSDKQLADLRLLLGRMTYFGRAESWCRAEAHTCAIEKIPAEGESEIVPAQTHWECPCVEMHGKPAGQEYREYLLERRLASIGDLKKEVCELLPRTKSSDAKTRKPSDAVALQELLTKESPATLLLRCLLRESGQDIKDGLERPIGTHWVHFAVPRAVYDVPRAKARPRPRPMEAVDLIRYALNTATVGRAVLPSITDTLLVADKFRRAAMALCGKSSHKLSGHKRNGDPGNDHRHAFWWPLDEDNDGFIDHIITWARGGFEKCEVDAMRRLTRIRQRGGRPDLLVTPVFVGLHRDYPPWQALAGKGSNETDQRTDVFYSATPYYCPVHLSHGRKSGGRIRPITAEIHKGLIEQSIATDDDIEAVEELVFDYAPMQLDMTRESIRAGRLSEPVPPRQFFPLFSPPGDYPPLPRAARIADRAYSDALIKDPDAGFAFGTSIGLLVNDGTRFIRAMSFCRRRRNKTIVGHGRMFRITFRNTRSRQPFSIGDQCHFGMGLFRPEEVKS